MSQSSTHTSTSNKLQLISDLIEKLNWEPKRYLVEFLTAPSGNSVTKRRLWGSSGWESTKRLLQSIKAVVGKTNSGKALWEDFILDEAITITRKQKPRSGISPGGAYFSSKGMTEDFFAEDSQLERSQTLTRNEMPFLYNLLLGKLDRKKENKISVDKEETSDDEPDEINSFDCPAPVPFFNDNNNYQETQLSLTEDDVVEVDSNVVRPHSNPTIRRVKQNEDIAKTICSMVAFGCNRRHNGLQMSNGLLFIACGVTERVNRYLNYIGISCSRKTAHFGLAALGKEAESKIKHLLSHTEAKTFSPSFCIDNLDFQQTIHTKSVGHSSTMFHGTWGYIHHLPDQFFNTLNKSQLTLAALEHSLKESISLKVRPRHFAPTFESNQHFEMTLKSQLTQVMLRYITYPTNKHKLLSINPPPVRPMQVEKANVTMLKLMMASDNSSEGIGDVLAGLIQQSGLSAQEFSSRLQVIEGDLGTCMNIASLRELRVPAGYSTTSLANILSIPGAAHTMWNFSQAIFLHHWGDQTNRQDTGAWRILKALGVPADKPVTKRDFTLMISNMEKIHEACLIYCILIVMKKEHGTLSDELQPMSPLAILEVVDTTYQRFLSGQALDTAIEKKQQKLINFLLCLRDFATVIEVNRSTKSGDTGRLLFMWKRWAVMGQGLKKLVHYSRHLPRLILLLNVILPKPLSSVIENTLLLCPSGRENHFVATDFYLEVQNYWLKYFYNHSGIGTNIERLRDVFSINIPILKRLMHILNRESGMNVVQQSHKNVLDNTSINTFLTFANQHNICLTNDKPGEFVPGAITDVYKTGIEAIQEKFAIKKGGLDRLKPAYIFDQAMQDLEHPASTNGSDTTDSSGSSESSEDSE